MEEMTADLTRWRETGEANAFHGVEVMPVGG